MSAASDIGGTAVLSINDLPLVGRETELQALRRGLLQAKAGSGSAWGLVGPGGIGKTRLLRTLESEAQQQGVQVRWGYCLKEALSPFLPFEQIFRSTARSGTEGAPSEPAEVAGATILYEEERPRKVLSRALSLGASHPLLVIGRDRPASLRQKFPELPASSDLLWLTRTEGPDCISPGAIDSLGERIDTFLNGHPGGVVALTGLEYMISQNGFLPVLRLVQMLRDVAESTQGTLLLAVHAATLEGRERSLLEAEGEVVRESAPAPATEAPPAAEPPALRLLRYLESLREEARGKPQLLLIDDLQWADPQSRTAFQFLARNARDLPVMLVGALRGDDSAEPEAPGDDPLSEVLDHMDQEGILRQVHLGGLPASAAGRLVQGMLGVPLAAGPSDRAFLDVLERTGGNPYFLLESLQQLLDQGFLVRQGDHAVLSLPSPAGKAGKEGPQVPIPPTIRRLVSRRLESLPKEDLRFLEVASVIGSEFDLPPLGTLLKLPSADLEDTARRMVRKLRLLQPGEREGSYEFAHPLVWEVLRETIDPAAERETALQLARWWERERPQDAETLARLYHTARDRDAGLAWVEKALDAAVAAKAPGVTLRYLSWRRDLLSDSAADLALRAEREVPIAVRLHREGAGDASRQLAEELVKLPLNPPLRWEATLAHIAVNYDLHADESDAELQKFERELLSGRSEVPPDLMARARHQEAVIAIAMGKWEAGFSAAARLHQLPQDRLSKDTIVAGLLAEVFCLKELGRMPEALERLDEAQESLPLCQIPETAIRFYNVEGAVRFAVGDLKGAKKAIDRAVQLAHEAGNVILEVLYLGNACNIIWVQGDLELSLKRADEGIALAQKFNYEKGIHNIRRVRCSVLRDLGRFDESERDLHETIEWLRKAGQSFYVAECQSSLANLRGCRGDARGAVEEFNALEPVYRDLGVRMLSELCVDRARWRARSGDIEGARKDLADAVNDPEARRNAAARAHLELTRAEVEEAAGEKEKARRARREGIDLLKSVGATRYRGTPLEDLEKTAA